jgi:isopentenyl diphosphate isomerase/L-lactate dehydrogenase-like FMN-dependent dehydrogenase
MALIFISYSSKDRETATEIFDTLEDNGFDHIFLDHDTKNGIKSGEDWEKRLYKEIRRSHAMMLLLSPNWIKSKWLSLIHI